MTRKLTTHWHMMKFSGQGAFEQEDEIAEEFPLTLYVDGEEFATIVCSPTELTDLVVGFLASEGVIRQAGELKTMSVDEDRGIAYAELIRPQSVGKEYYAKRFIGSCCGKSRQFYFQNDVRTAKTSVSQIRIKPEQVYSLMETLQRSSVDFRNTGGLHNAALCSVTDVLATRADIGRHNALDKLFGHCLRNRWRTSDKIIAFSGRLSSEVVLKAAKIGVGVMLSKSAPTDLALSLADDLGITCVGFIRGSSMNVYTHRERIASPDVEV